MKNASVVAANTSLLLEVDFKLLYCGASFKRNNKHFCKKYSTWILEQKYKQLLKIRVLKNLLKYSKL